MSSYTLCRALLVALLPTYGACQSLGYQDADTPSEAVGMMQTTLMTARIMKERCGERFPELQAEMEENLSKWRAKEATTIRKSNLYWAEMVRKDPKTAQSVPAVEAAIRKSMAAVAEVPGDAGARVFSQTCKQHFSALASGIWRTRTPNAYKYLDAAP